MNKDGKFKVGNKLWKVNRSTWHEREKKKSPTGIEPMTSRTPCGRSIHLATRTRGEYRHGILGYFDQRQNQL